jgi:hypothetical protein
VYSITVRNESGGAGTAVEVKVDGRVSSDGSIQLVDDGHRHDVVVQRTGA